jgi:hypothetical protein
MLSGVQVFLGIFTVVAQYLCQHFGKIVLLSGASVQLLKSFFQGEGLF